MTDMTNKFDIDNISIECHWLPNIYWIPEKCKSQGMATFIIASLESPVKPLARARTSVVCLFMLLMLQICSFLITILILRFSDSL